MVCWWGEGEGGGGSRGQCVVGFEQVIFLIMATNCCP